MGNAWAKYLAFDAEVFEQRFWHLPERLDARGYGGIASQEAELLAALYARREQGRQAAAEVAQRLLDHCASACRADVLDAWDVCKQMNGGCLEVDRLLQGTAHTAWKQFTRALGFPTGGRNMPWWIHAAYPGDHYVGLSSPAEVQELCSGLRDTRVLDQVLARITPGDAATAATLRRLSAFIDAAGAQQRWLLAIESHS